MIISIDKCTNCATIPQKMYFDLLRDSEAKLPDQLWSYRNIVSFNDESVHRYCSSTTWLKKCDNCDTYYYINNYDDDGEYFMDSKYNTYTLRRYSHSETILFLKGLLNKSGNMPHATGQLIKSFLDNSGAPDSDIKLTPEEITEIIKEYEYLINNQAKIIQKFKESIKQPEPNWHTKIYLTESLCQYFLENNQIQNLITDILQNNDKVIRLYSALYIIGTGTNDAPVIDLIHIPAELRKKFKSFTDDKKNLEILGNIFTEFSFSENFQYLHYDHGFGTSTYYNSYTVNEALYGLLLISKQIDLKQAIPELINLLFKDMNNPYSRIVDILKNIADNKKYPDNKKIIKDLLIERIKDIEVPEKMTNCLKPILKIKKAK